MIEENANFQLGGIKTDLDWIKRHIIELKDSSQKNSELLSEYSKQQISTNDRLESIQKGMKNHVTKKDIVHIEGDIEEIKEFLQNKLPVEYVKRSDFDLTNAINKQKYKWIDKLKEVAIDHFFKLIIGGLIALLLLNKYTEWL